MLDERESLLDKVYTLAEVGGHSLFDELKKRVIRKAGIPLTILG